MAETASHDVLGGDEPHWKSVIRKLMPLPQRTILALMIFVGVVLAYGMRISLSQTIESLFSYKKTNFTVAGECPFPHERQNKCVSDDESIELKLTINWNDRITGFVLVSFYIGYVVTHVPGGIAADILGGKYILAGCIGLSSLLNVMIPFCITHGGPYAVIFIQITMGLIQGVMFPAVSALLAAWIPFSERGFYGGTVYSSGPIGTVCGSAISMELMHRFKSWNSVFFIFGIAGFIWCVLFCFICSSNPIDHPYISKKEKMMLLEEIGIIRRTTSIKNLPWIGIITNLPLMSLVIIQIGHDFGFFLMVVYLPNYVVDVLHYSMTTIKTSFVFYALPFIVLLAVSIVSGFICDLMIAQSWMNVIGCRKLYTVFASFFPAVSLAGASYAECDLALFIVYCFIGMAGMGTFYSGPRINGLDLSLRYAGTVMAFINGFGAIMGLVVPYLFDVLTPNSAISEFRRIFGIAFILYFGAIIIYLYFATSEVQAFDKKGGPNNN